jgi:hypothetical protein
MGERKLDYLHNSPLVRDRDLEFKSTTTVTRNGKIDPRHSRDRNMEFKSTATVTRQGNIGQRHLLNRLLYEENGYNSDYGSYFYNTLYDEHLHNRLKPLIKEMVRQEIEEMKGVNSKMKKEEKTVINLLHVYYSFCSILIAIFTMLLSFKIIPMIPGIIGLLFSVGVLVSVIKGEKNWKLEINEPTTTSPRSN